MAKNVANIRMERLKQYVKAQKWDDDITRYALKEIQNHENMRTAQDATVVEESDAGPTAMKSEK